MIKIEYVLKFFFDFEAKCSIVLEFATDEQIFACAGLNSTANWFLINIFMFQ